MSSPKLNSDLSNLVKTKIKQTLVEQDVQNLDEAYVAQPKKFSQVSETLSTKTKESHSELYKAYIESLNKISAQLDNFNKEGNSNNSEWRCAKIDETYNLNATWLHELYFANCFDPHSEVFMDSQAFMKFQRDWGTFEDWQKDFLATGLSAREGWVVCGYNIFLRRFVNTIIDLHSTNVMVGLIPIVVVDMWSHSYYKDFLNDKKSYLVAMMRELNWNIIEERTEKVLKLEEAIK